jgi:DNA-directed RNA polymerase specialized sigma24 family protein
MEYKTSWSTNELAQLIDYNNHKIVYDGYHYVWHHYLNNTWEIHTISLFEDHKKAYTWIHTNIYRWTKEITARRKTEQSKDYFKAMSKRLEVDKKISDIAKDAIRRTKDKVQQIITLRPTISNKDIAEMLDISIRSVERHRSKL